MGASMQYWKPEEPYSIGDAMPFWWQGTYHLFYLVDEGHHSRFHWLLSRLAPSSLCLLPLLMCPMLSVLRMLYLPASVLRRSHVL